MQPLHVSASVNRILPGKYASVPASHLNTDLGYVHLAVPQILVPLALRGVLGSPGSKADRCGHARCPQGPTQVDEEGHNEHLAAIDRKDPMVRSLAGTDGDVESC